MSPWDVVEHKATRHEAFVVGRYQICRALPRDAAVLADGRGPADPLRALGPAADDDDHRRPTRPPRSSPTASASIPTSACRSTPAATRRRPWWSSPPSSYWVLNEFLPTGEIRPVDARLDFRKGQPRKGLKLDDVLTGMEFEGDRATCRLVDQALGAEFRLSFDRNFRELVAYTALGRGRDRGRAVHPDDRRDQPRGPGGSTPACGGWGTAQRIPW